MQISATPDERRSAASLPTSRLEPPLHFDAVLEPHRSLNRAGFLIVMTLICGISFGAGISFLTVGAWPVFGYCGLDVALIYWAFRANYKAARAHETVQVSDNELRIRKVDQVGRVRTFLFEPYWARLELLTHADETTTLTVSAKGKQLEIARMLSPGERADFADALERVLIDLKQGRLTAIPPQS